VRVPRDAWHRRAVEAEEREKSELRRRGAKRICSPCGFLRGNLVADAALQKAYSRQG